MEIDFDKFKELQYCDNELCKYHNQIGQGNICILSRKNNQVYCNGCRNRWVLTKDTFFYDLRSEKSLIIRVLKDLSEGKGQRAIQRTDGVTLTTQKRWLLRAADHVLPISEYLEKNMRLSRIQIDEFCGAARAVFHSKKKKILHPMKWMKTYPLWATGGLLWLSCQIVATLRMFTAVSEPNKPHNYFYNKSRIIAMEKPLFLRVMSDRRCGWFYEEVLTQVYGTLEPVAYRGIGRRPLPKQVPDPDLKYAQIVKERQNGKVVSISTRIVLGDELQILEILENSERCKTISTARAAPLLC